jgi:hypothetical protein
MPHPDEDGVARIVGLILLLGGLCFLAASAYIARQQAVFVRASHKAAGVVIANEWRENTIQSGDETPGGWAPIVRFQSAGGYSITFTSDISNYPSPDYAVGERVEVLYDADDPDHAEIDDFLRLWLVPLILFGIGGVMALFGVRLPRIDAARRRAYP